MIEDILGPRGDLSRMLPGFSYRPEQIQVARQIAAAFDRQEICLAEAGTGVGKTMAYLIPALEQICNKKRVVVSTHTLNLQGQLIQKDIPLLQRIAGESVVDAVLVKGMGNYLCLNSLDYERGLPLRDAIFERIAQWSRTTETGDVAELNFNVRGWSELACDRDLCRRQECRHYDDCFYFRMRWAAEQAQLIVANHALFFSDLAIRMVEPKAGILPDYDFVVFDEAHHLEDVASRIFGIEFSNYRVPHFLNRVRRLHGANVDPSKLDAIETWNDDFFTLFGSIRKQEFFLTDVFDPGALTEVNSRGARLQLLLKDLQAALMGEAHEVKDLDENLHDRLESYASSCTNLSAELNLILSSEEKGWFAWGERPTQPGRLVHTILHRTPVKVSELLREHFWSRTKGAALLSATLSNSGGFSYARSRLGIDEAREVVVGSPFDFPQQSLLYIPAHLPFPSSDPAYADGLTAEIAQILEYSQGRAFLLFTSYRMLDRIHAALAPQLPFPLLKQGEMPNQALLEEFRKLPNACLFGTNSFWEGVDVQGEALSCVIIDKLPFSVPDTPVARARMAAIEEEGGNPFSELSVPEAQIRLKQGFGRLIRTVTDRGVVAIFDSRLVKKSYGRSFLQVLPPARRTSRLEDVKRFFEE